MWNSRFDFYFCIPMQTRMNTNCLGEVVHFLKNANGAISFSHNCTCVFFTGIKPSSDTWSEEVTLMLKRLVCNRFIQVEVLGERDGMALVSMVDESSDPQTNVTEMLVAAGYAALGDRETKQEAAKDISENPGLSMSNIS